LILVKGKTKTSLSRSKSLKFSF